MDVFFRYSAYSEMENAQNSGGLGTAQNKYAMVFNLSLI